MSATQGPVVEQRLAVKTSFTSPQLIAASHPPSPTSTCWPTINLRMGNGFRSSGDGHAISISGLARNVARIILL